MQQQVVIVDLQTALLMDAFSKSPFTTLIILLIMGMIGIWILRNFMQIFKWLDREITFVQIFTHSNLKDKNEK